MDGNGIVVITVGCFEGVSGNIQGGKGGDVMIGCGVVCILLPEATSQPKTNNIKLTINVIKRNGINTKIQEINPKSK